jgi:hypothetical protein
MMHFAAFLAIIVSVVLLNDIPSLRSCSHITAVSPSTSPAPFPRIYYFCFNFLCIELYFSGPSFVCLPPNLQTQELPFVGCPPPCFEYIGR